ncbi:MAG: hypothetical protein AMS15_06980 [Planctomycetes bacterium DG_23]|nr:MAG: hypothetical protein AMS15_06980 [Planctomycetes bacterium DG_23]
MVEFRPFGEIAVGLGFCSRQDVEKGLEVQSDLRREGRKHKLIGMILLESGAISSSQLIQILRIYEEEAEARKKGN